EKRGERYQFYKIFHLHIVTCITDFIFSTEWQPPESVKVLFERKQVGKMCIPFTGTPFTFIGSKTLMCHRGKDKNTARKKKYAEKQMEPCDHEYRKRRLTIQDTKKIDCPAYISITRVAAFTDKKFQIDKNTDRVKRNASGLIRKWLSMKEHVKMENRYYVLLPNVEDHLGHQLTGEAALIHETVDERVIKKIEELSKEGQVTTVPQMQKFIKIFVKNELFHGLDLPTMLERRYYPLDKDIRNILDRVQSQSMHSKDDQINLQ
ncbi:unnamed protein product, partial [Meganyctiphanes norvegica]